MYSLDKRGKSNYSGVPRTIPPFFAYTPLLVLGASLDQNIYTPTPSVLTTKVVNFKVHPFYCIFG